MSGFEFSAGTGVHFAFNSAKIRPEDEAVLDEAAESIKANPNVKINVTATATLSVALPTI